MAGYTAAYPATYPAAVAVVPLTATYATAGPFAWTCPAGVTSVTVACTGGGGSGSAAAATGSQGGGGGGGETAYEPAIPVTPGASYLVVVGGGGTGSVAGGGAASTAGGDSSFAGDPAGGVTLVVRGHGGQRGIGGTTGAGPGGAGGTGSTNSVTAAGGAGDDGTVSTSGGGGGGAGGVSASQGFPGGNASGATAGAGGAGTFPGGSGGAGRTTGTSNGTSGTAPGGGAGGALSTGTARGGGNGADGQVVITWSMTDPVTLSAGTAGGAWTFTAPLGTTTVKAEAAGAGAGGFNTTGGSNTATCGSSAFTSAYGKPRSAAATTFDNRVGRPMALASQVTYYIEEEYPSGPGPLDQEATGELTAMGCKIIASFRCSRRAAVAGGSTLAAQQALLAAAIDYLVAVPGINLGGICIANEPSINGQHGPFGDGSVKDWNKPNPYGASVTPAQTAANFLNYWAAYQPTIAAHLAGTGIPIVYKPTVTSQDMAISMFPGAPGSAGGCDAVFIDWYANDNPKDSSGISSATPFGAGNIEAICDANGVPLGLGEWGAAGGSSNTNLANWNAYITKMKAGFQARFNAGKPVFDVVYFAGLSTTGNNTVTSSTDYKVAGIQQVYDLFAGVSTPVGGAGGGGGEYAAETALAITGLRKYAITVGAGGTPKTSGGSSSVAGDAVTVTGHGGAAATSAAAGGAGGTGYASGTHFDGGAGGKGGGSGGAGGGGGSSGGTAAAGNAGAAGSPSTGGTGGAAVTGGGPGAKGGGPAGNGLTPASGPGGGGGARGASGSNNGSGFDGQIILSNFNSISGAQGSAALGALTVSGTGTINAGNAALGTLTAAGTGSVGGFTLLQQGVTATGSANVITFTLPGPSTAGTLLLIQFNTTGQGGSTSSPAGWTQAKAQNTGGASGRAELWYLPGHLNPGGQSSFAFGYTSGDTRGRAAEFATPAGTTQALDGTPASSSGAAAAASVTCTTGSSSAVGDLGIFSVNEQFSAGPASNPFATPAGWTLLSSQGIGITTSWAYYYKTGLNSGTQTVTETFTVTANELGCAGILAVFTLQTVNTTTGSATLGPMAAAATGTSGVPAGTVVGSGAGALSALAAQSPSTAQTFPEDPLPVTVEILLGGTWTDITSYVYLRDGISIQNRGRPNEGTTAQPAQCTLTLDNRDGNFQPQNTNGIFYPYLVRNAQLRVGINNAVTTTGANWSGYRFWGQVPAWPLFWDVSGRDVYVQITAVGALQRMLQSKYSASPLARYYTNIMNNALNASPGSVPLGVGLVPAAYWPCEDDISSSTFASGLPGGSPMTWTGTPGLGSDSSVPGSGAFAQLNGSIWTGIPGAFTSGGITFSTPGTFSWTCPDGVTDIQAECWGGGGGGGGIDCFGNGGGGGEYAKEPHVAVTPGTVYTVKVGQGGDGSKGGGPAATGTQGGDGTRSTFAGDNLTVTAHGGQGAHTHITNTAFGGTGSTNSVHHDGGDGATNPTNGQFGGEGGGGSGGFTTAGNNGQHNDTNTNAGGPGGQAVAGGGPGGQGGQGFNGGNIQPTGGRKGTPPPGGGGGGGGFNNFINYRHAGGGGQNGQVTLTFDPAKSRPHANVIRAVISIPSGGGLTGAQYVQAVTTGTVKFLNLTNQGGGTLAFRGRDAGNNLLFDSGNISFSATGQPLLVSMELTKSKTDPAKVNWKLTAIKPGGADVVNTANGSVTATLGNVTQVNVNNAAGATDTNAIGVGHVSVQYQVDPISNLAPALNAYTGELAADRFLRLCLEQTVPVQIFTSGATAPDTPAMGPQPSGLLVNLLQDCENADLGLMFERRDTFGLGYITRVALQNQPAAAALDYAARQLGADLAPTNDEQLIRNDIIATRGNGQRTDATVTTASGQRVHVAATGAGGSTYEAIQTSGPLSVLDPPNGVGLYQYQVTVNLHTDDQLPPFTTWLLALGTLDEYRYPVITIDLRRPGVRDGTFSAVASLDIGNMVTISNPPAWLPPYPINQLCYGISETLNAFEWTIQVNAVPADLYLSTSAFPVW